MLVVGILETGQNQPDVADRIVWVGPNNSQRQQVLIGLYLNIYRAGLLPQDRDTVGEVYFAVAVIKARILARDIAVVDLAEDYRISELPALGQ